MNGLETLALIRGLSGGGGSGTTYSAGDGIDITDSKISAKIDDSTIKFNSEGKMYSTGSVDLTRKDFTSKNVVIETEHKSGCYFMTRGDEVADALVWENGRIEFSLGAHTELASGYTELYLVDYALEEETSEVFEFGESTVGQYTGLIWEVYDGIFNFKMKTSDGTEVVIATKDINNKIAHFEGSAWECPSVTLVSVSGKLFDPNYELPHDVRLDYAFDTPGYVKVGQKVIQLRDLTIEDDIKEIDYDDIYSFYDGENTIMYDFFAKDYSMIYEGSKREVDIEIAITTNTDMTFGIYDQSTNFQMIEMGSYSADVEYIEFKATCDESGYYTMRWYCKSKDRVVVWTSDEQSGWGPYGIYVKFAGKVDIWDCMKPVESTGTYVRFNPNTTQTYAKGDFSRDFRIDRYSSAYYGLLKYCAAMDGYDDKNYYITNGYIHLVPNNIETGALPIGEWGINWFDENGSPLTWLEFTYNEEHGANGRIRAIELIREARGIRVVVTYEDGTLEKREYDCDRNQFAYMKMQWSPLAVMPEELPEWFSEATMNCIFERKYTYDIATTDTYGSVKYDSQTIAMNEFGQLYATPNIYTAGKGISIDGNVISTTDSSDVFMATYGTTTYADLKAAYDAGKHIYVNVNDTAASTNYYAALGKFIETTNTFFFPTTNYEGYLVQYFCSQSSGWGNEQVQFQPKLTAGTGISISADNVISVITTQKIDELEAKIAKLEAAIQKLSTND